MIPYMHNELAAERIAEIYEQAQRERTARVLRQARRTRRRGTEPAPGASLVPLPARRTWHLIADGTQLAAAGPEARQPGAHKKVA